MPVNNLTIIFCEDVREEEGNKLSIMGMLGPKLVVPKLPGIMPKLCIVLMADVIGEQEVAVTCAVTSVTAKSFPPALETIVKPPTPTDMWSIRTVLTLQNLALPSSSSIDVKFGVGDGYQERSLFIDCGEGAKAETKILASGTLPHT